MDVQLEPHRVSIVLLSITAVLAGMHIAQLVVYFYIGDPGVFNFIHLVDFDYEGNLPSLYSSFALAFAALLLSLIAINAREKRAAGQFHWVGLAIIFLFLAVDEGIGLHEEIGDVVEGYVKAEGYLYFPWAIPYGIATVLFVLSYLRFLLLLPRRTALRFLVAGAVFVSGALGLELLSAREADLHGTKTILYSALYTAEELCEMIGVVIFIHALLEYLAREVGRISILVGSR